MPIPNTNTDSSDTTVYHSKNISNVLILKRNIYNTIQRKISTVWWWWCIACTLPTPHSPCCHLLATAASQMVIMWTVLTAVWSISYWVSQWKNITNNNTTQYLQILPSTQLPNASIVLTLKWIETVPIATQFYNFQPLHRRWAPKLPTSLMIDTGAIWQIHYNYTANNRTAEQNLHISSGTAIITMLQGHSRQHRTISCFTATAECLVKMLMLYRNSSEFRKNLTGRCNYDKNDPYLSKQ